MSGTKTYSCGRCLASLEERVTFWDGETRVCDTCYGKWLEDQGGSAECSGCGGEFLHTMLWHSEDGDLRCTRCRAENVAASYHTIEFVTTEPMTRTEVLAAIKEAFRLATDDCIECAKCDNETEDDPGEWLQKLERLGSVRIDEKE